MSSPQTLESRHQPNPVLTEAAWGSGIWPVEPPCKHNTLTDTPMISSIMQKAWKIVKPAPPCPCQQAINKHEAALQALTFSGNGIPAGPPRVTGCTLIPKDMIEQWAIKLPHPVCLDSFVLTTADGIRQASLDLLRAAAPELTKICVCNWVKGPSYVQEYPVADVKIHETCVRKTEGEGYTLDLLVFAVMEQYIRWLNLATAEQRREAAEFRARTGLTRSTPNPPLYLVGVRKQHYALGIFAWMAHVTIRGD
ncbi:hypothetical protein BC628DRAFT_1339444 [Trametes gibbosa]|nr:hypothetical protein BC628DRAFT_1339444 [Trametes gibbosa]